jgi:hemerythrin
MSFVQWDASMSVGVPRIDGQHKELIDIINELAVALGTNRQRDVVAGAVDTLLRYVREHLRDEEALMRETGYPYAEQHVKEHQGFEAALEEFDLGQGELDLEAVNKMFFFLTSWLVNHICVSDQKIGRHLAGSNQAVQAG